MHLAHKFGLNRQPLAMGRPPAVSEKESMQTCRLHPSFHLGLAEKNPPVHDRVVLDPLQLVGHVAWVLLRDIEVPCAGLADKLDQDLAQLFLARHSGLLLLLVGWMTRSVAR